MLWVVFNQNGQLLNSYNVGSVPTAGTNNFAIFAVFKELNIANDGDYTGGSIKLYKPDLKQSSYLPFIMTVETFAFNGPTNNDLQNNVNYNGVYFNFENADVAEPLLDTIGLWRAVITLLHVSDPTLRNVIGSVTFNIGNGIESVDGNEVDVEDVLNQIYQGLNSKLNINSENYVKAIATADIDSYEFGASYNVGDYVLNKTDGKLYKLNADKEPVFVFDLYGKLIHIVYLENIDSFDSTNYAIGDYILNSYDGSLYILTSHDELLLTNLKLDSASIRSINTGSYTIEQETGELSIDGGNVNITLKNSDDEIDIVSGTLLWNNKAIATEEYVTNTYADQSARINAAGHKIDLSINSNYVLIASLLDKNNNVISTSDVDLPLESIIVSATYYDEYEYGGETYEKVIVVVLATTPVPTIIPVGDLVSGLVSTQDLSTILADYALKAGPLPFFEVNAKMVSIKEFLTDNGLFTNPKPFIVRFKNPTNPKETYLMMITPNSTNFDFEIEQLGTDVRYSGTNYNITNATKFSDLMSNDYKNDYEESNNKVTSISASSTNDEYPSAKLLYDQLLLKEDKSNKVTSLSGSSTDTQYPSAKAVWDNLENVRSVAEGKCKTIRMKLTPTVIAYYWEAAYLDENLEEKVFESTEEYNAWLSGKTRINDSFNSNSNAIYISSSNTNYIDVYPINIESNSTPHLFILESQLQSYLHKGDIILITDINVPDRWYFGYMSPTVPGVPSGNVFYELEVDLHNMMTTDTTQTITGTKTIEGTDLNMFDGGVTFQNETAMMNSIGENYIYQDATGSFVFGLDHMGSSYWMEKTNFSYGANNIADLGSSSYKWKDLYLGGAINISGVNYQASITNTDNRLNFTYGGATRFLVGNSEVKCFNNFIPNSTGTLDLGGSSNKWKDLYLGGKAYFYNSNTATYGSIEIDNYGGFAFKKSGTTAFSIGGTDVRFYGRHLLPSPGNTDYSLGQSDSTWKDLYLSGSAILGNGTNTWEFKTNSSNYVDISYNGSNKLQIRPTLIYPTGNFDLGTASAPFRDVRLSRDLYLDGAIKDSTNSVSVAQIVGGLFNVLNASDIVSNTLTQDQYDLITNGKPTLIVGALDSTTNPIILNGNTSDNTSYRALFVGKESNGNSTKIRVIQINISTKVISFSSNTTYVESNGKLSATFNLVNNKTVPSYPSNTGTFAFKQVNGTLAWKGEEVLTQSAYDALVSGGTVDSDTFYFIEE